MVLQGAATENTLIGTGSGKELQTGAGNVAIGHAALYNTNNDESRNTAVGYASLYSLDGDTTNTVNTAVGYASGYYITTGIQNTHIGYTAGYGDSGAVSTGDGNTTLGYGAGYYIQGASHSNTYIGTISGNVTTTGVENTCLGYNTDIQDATATNQIVIGNNLTGTKDNAVFIGNDSSHIENDFNADATWNHSSDIRQKTNIEDDILGLDFIKNLKTRTYKHKSPSEFPQEWDAYDKDNKEPMGGDKVIHGFIAQEVKEALDNANVDTFQGWSEGPDGRQRVSFEAFVLPLIKSVQELSNEVNELKKQLKEK